MNFEAYFPDNKYIRHYLKLVRKRLQRPAEVDYEEHHILPKSMFPEHRSNPENFVKLKYREHYIAHLLLWKGTKSVEMARAFYFMSNLHECNSRLYDAIRIEVMKLPHPSEGNVTINKDGKFKIVSEDSLEEYIEMGWTIGGIGGENSHMANRIRIHKNGMFTYVLKGEARRYLDNGWDVETKMVYETNYTYVKKNGKKRQIYKSEMEKYFNDGWVRTTSGSMLDNKARVRRGEKIICVEKSDVEQYAKDGWEEIHLYAAIDGYISVTKDGIQKFVIPSEVHEYVSNGWTASGRESVIKNKIALINSNGENVYVNSEEVDNYLSNGWRKGNTLTGRVGIVKDGSVKYIPKDKLQEFKLDGWELITDRNKRMRIK